MSEEVKKKGLLSRLFKGSVYEETDEESVEVSEASSVKAEEEAPEEISGKPLEASAPLTEEATEAVEEAGG